MTRRNPAEIDGAADLISQDSSQVNDRASGVMTANLPSTSTEHGQVVQIIPATDWWVVRRQGPQLYERERLVCWGLTSAGQVVPIAVEGPLDPDYAEVLDTEHLSLCDCNRGYRCRRADELIDPDWCDRCAGITEWAS